MWVGVETHPPMCDGSSISLSRDTWVRSYSWVHTGKVAKAMELFIVCDSAGKVRYEGKSLGQAYGIWKVLAVQHDTYMMDEFGNVQTDMDCGGGHTLDWSSPDEFGSVRIMDTSCGREGSCYDCTDDTEYMDAMGYGVPVDARSEPWVTIMGEDFAPWDIGECCNCRADLHDPDGHEFASTLDPTIKA